MVEKAIHTLKIDPELQDLIPNLSEDEMERSRRSIVQEGCRDALAVWNETIIDGYNRYDICHRNRIPFSYETLDFDSKDAVKVWMINHQLGQRNLTPYQRTALALKEKQILEAEAKERQRESGKEHGRGKNGKVDPNLDQPISRAPQTLDRVAQKAGVSRGTAYKVEKIEEEGDEETKQKLRNGEMSINSGYLATRPKAGAEDSSVAGMPDMSPDAVSATVVQIERVKEARFVVRLTNGETIALDRTRLLKKEGYKKCKHCSGYGVKLREADRSASTATIYPEDYERTARILKKHFDREKLIEALGKTGYEAQP